MAHESPKANETDEQSLVEAARKDPNRFAELYEIHFHRVYAFIVRRVSDRNIAQDLTSDVFHHALAHLHGFEWRGISFAAWLFRIASNAVTDHFRRAAKETGRPALDPPDDTSENMERHAILFTLVDQLPADQKQVVRMRFSRQMSIREIAQQLRRSEGAVKQLQFRALETLRKQMRDSNG